MGQSLEVRIEQVGPSTAKGIARTHSVLIDRPVAKGGEDRGPLGGEYLLLALGGCFMSNLLAAIRARDSNISDVHTEVIGTIADSPARFETLELVITADGPDREALPRLVEIADRGCIMMNTLRGKLDVKLRIGISRHSIAQ